MCVILWGSTRGLETTGRHKTTRKGVKIRPRGKTLGQESPRMCVLADESKRTKLASNKTLRNQVILSVFIKRLEACPNPDRFQAYTLINY